MKKSDYSYRKSCNSNENPDSSYTHAYHSNHRARATTVIVLSQDLLFQLSPDLPGSPGSGVSGSSPRALPGLSPALPGSPRVSGVSGGSPRALPGLSPALPGSPRVSGVSGGETKRLTGWAHLHLRNTKSTMVLLPLNHELMWTLQSV